MWHDNFDVTNQSAVVNNRNKALDDELKALRKASIMVRRDALKKLLSKNIKCTKESLTHRAFVCIKRDFRDDNKLLKKI